MSGNFLDSNVFLYVFDRQDPGKQAKAQELIREALQSGDAAISLKWTPKTGQQFKLAA